MIKIIYADDFDFSLIKKVGFDGVFIKYTTDENARKLKEKADENGLIISSLHAPSALCNLIYTTSPKPYITQQKALIDLCYELGIKYLITHASLKIDIVPYAEIGAARYAELFEYAYSKNVELCIENIEHPHVEYLMQSLYGKRGGGMCLDTGHNNAYTPNADYSKYTPKYLHLNDNLGMRGKTYHIDDDMHLIPFDGNADFNKICATLKKQGYDGHLTFELKKHNTHFYDNLTDEEFLRKAYSVAVKIETMIKG